MTVELAYRETGEGSPIIILHGLCGSGSNWRSIAKQLGESHRVVCVDLRNHGDSPHAESMSYRNMAGDVRALMDRLDLAQAALIGHSMGGKTAMQLALAEPRRVERLVVVDIAPVTTEEDYTPYISAMQSLDLSGIQRRTDADRELTIDIPEPAVRTFLLKNLVNENGGFRWRLNLDAIEASLSELADFPDQRAGASYNGPTLFVRGARSRYVRSEHHPVIDRLFPDARIASIDDAGHWVHVDQPSRFVEAVDAFLAPRA